jgi:hypothetical protein
MGGSCSPGALRGGYFIPRTNKNTQIPAKAPENLLISILLIP